jgi:hypothetical protein
MRIHLHIERLILDGLPVTSLQGPQILAAVEQELGRLLTAHGLLDELRGGIAVPRVRAGAIQLEKENPPARLGQSIARAVHEGIGNPGRVRAADASRPDSGGKPR